MSSPSAVVCREIFDENSQPSAEEISEYAQQLGIDPESESHLLPLAKDGLMQPLPAPWKAYFDEKLQTHYYYNEDTKKTQWEHPLDHVYRELVKKARDASVLDDTCASVQELLTSEENTKHLERVETKAESDEEFSTDSENHVSDVKENISSTLVPGPRRLAPLGRPPIPPLTRFDKKLNDLRISPLRRSVENPVSSKPALVRNTSDRDLLSRPSFERPKMLYKQQSEIIDLKMHVLTSPEEENFSPLLLSAKVDKGLPLTGKGSMFLKLSKSDLPSPDTDKSHPLDSMTKSDPPKGILREKASDPFHKKAETVLFGRPKTASFEDDRKSVRFKLENLPEPTISPGSNSSSEQNDNQSSIISAPVSSPPVTSPQTVTSPHKVMASSQQTVMSPHQIMTSSQTVTSQLQAMTSQQAVTSPHKLMTSAQTVTSQHQVLISQQQTVTSPHQVMTSQQQTVISPNQVVTSQQTVTSPNQVVMSPLLSGIVLSPLASRPPLPPRHDSPRDSIESESHQSNHTNQSSQSNHTNQSNQSSQSRASPRRRVLRPPASDYIKPDLFQKNFQKLSDLVRPGDIEPTITHLEEPLAEKETRPRSPMIPLKSKISINLMESIESETSIDSPDREFANLDLNDLDDSNDTQKDKQPSENEPKSTSNKGSLKENADSKTTEKSDNKSHRPSESIPIPQIKVPTLDLPKHLTSDTENSKSLEESKLSKSSIDIPKSSQAKISPTPSLGSDVRSPRFDFGKPWSPLSTFKPLNKAVIAPQMKTDTSNINISKGLTSPRLDGVILSQGKSSSDNVVVVYQFETQEDCIKPIKSPLIPDMARDMIERNKADERRRLELSMQKELESIRVEWTAKERKMRAELQEDLRAAEEKFLSDKRVRLNEQAERHRREMEEALTTAERNYKQSLQTALTELDDKHRREIESVERQHADSMARLKMECKAKLVEQQRQLEIENERALSELREQFQASLSRERAKIADENKATIAALREEHAARVADLRHDYRAEVEHLRRQHLCHVEEVRARLASQRRAPDNHHNDKYRALKEKYARLKHDVKMSIERRNKRREMSMTTGSETEKSNSHKGNQSLERCKEANETSVSVIIESEPHRSRSRSKRNDNDTSHSESNALSNAQSINTQSNAYNAQCNTQSNAQSNMQSNAQNAQSNAHNVQSNAQSNTQSNAYKAVDNNNDEWKIRRLDISLTEASQTSVKPRSHRRGNVAFREPLARRRRGSRDKDNDAGATTDCQDSSDATTADEKPKETVNGQGRRRCFTRLKSASTSRLNYSPKRGEGWSSPLESLRQQLRKLDDLEDQFPDLACQPSYSLRYPFSEIGTVSTADTPELEFVRHRALVEREGMRRARAALKRRRAALKETRASLEPHRAPSEEREATELEVALHRARALLGEKEIRLRHIERALRQLAPRHSPVAVLPEDGTSDASSDSETNNETEAGGAVLRSLRALHADVRDIWRALDARRGQLASPETSSCNAASTSQTRLTLSAPDPMIQDNSDGGVSERARGLRAWLQTAP